MIKGAICVKRGLIDRGFVVSDDKADLLWSDIKAYWRKQDEEDPVRPEDVPEGFTLEEMTCEPLIKEIEESNSGSLDTLPRDCLLDAVAKISGGVEWPVNGDSHDVKSENYAKIKKGLADRGIKRVNVRAQIAYSNTF